MQVIAIHDVDDVEHWFASRVRSEFFEARGMKVTAFRDPAGNGKTVAVLIDAPDMESLQAALASPEAKVAEEHDGVHVDTIKLFLDSVARRTRRTAARALPAPPPARQKGGPGELTLRETALDLRTYRGSPYGIRTRVSTLRGRSSSCHPVPPGAFQQLSVRIGRPPGAIPSSWFARVDWQRDWQRSRRPRGWWPS